MENAQAFKNQMDAEGRFEGEVSVHIGSRASFPGSQTVAIDTFMQSLGYQPLGEAWIRLDRQKLKEEFSSQLQTSLAYSVNTLPADEANEFASQFENLFDPVSGDFVTNWMNHSWNPIGRATMEAAYVGLDDSQLVLVLFEDED